LDARHGVCCCLLIYIWNAPPTPNPPLSLHDALPILEATRRSWTSRERPRLRSAPCLASSASRTPVRQSTRYPSSSPQAVPASSPDRKSTRLNSSHVKISYAVFCL